MSTLLHTFVYDHILHFPLHNLLNVPVQIANKMGSKKSANRLPRKWENTDVLQIFGPPETARNRIRNDTEIQDITPDYQFGFREHHSTIQ
jgi:hypothetical protein